MRIATITTTALMLAVSAEAHVRITPRESKVGATETYSARVPTEGKVATVSVELEVPTGVAILSAVASSEGNATLKKEGDRVIAVMWNVKIDPGAFAELTYVARNPTDGAEIVWKVHQRYADGSSSDWIGGPGTRAPAPITKLAGSSQGASADAAIALWLAEYDDAFNAKSLDRLAAFYHPDVTIFEGGGVNTGWADYRDNHIGPELKDFENLKFLHQNIAVHQLSPNGDAAYVTSEYVLKARVKGRDIDSGGLETLVLVKDAAGAWKIRHSHSSAKRRGPASGAGLQSKR